MSLQIHEKISTAEARQWLLNAHEEWTGKHTDSLNGEELAVLEAQIVAAKPVDFKATIPNKPPAPKTHPLVSVPTDPYLKGKKSKEGNMDAATPTTVETEEIPYPYPLDVKNHLNEEKKYKEHNKQTVYAGPKEEWEKRLAKKKKECSKCGEDKLLLNFSFNCSGNCHFNKEGYRHQRPECNGCNKKEKETCNMAQKKSKGRGEPIKAPPGTLCELCGKGPKLVYDHDHETCEFRGWLCDPCNRGLGQCGDNIEGLVKRLNYLVTKSDHNPIITQDPLTGILSVQ